MNMKTFDLSLRLRRVDLWWIRAKFRLPYLIITSFLRLEITESRKIFLIYSAVVLAI
jgi:hypothetical protein